MSTSELLNALGVPTAAFTGGTLTVRSPIDGAQLGAVHEATAAEMTAAVERAQAAFLQWRNVPAPKRGELVRIYGEELRANKANLARLVSLEAGKVTSEGEGEVQEMIDICDFAVGLSRQLHGLTIASERPGHRMMEQYLPLGVVGIISAFNFPVAVWAWNSALALVCGNTCLWKPSEKTPLTALATQALFDKALQRYIAAGHAAPAHLSQTLNGGAAVGEAMVDHPKVALVSATGSTRMGRAVGPRVAARFGRCLLELGGNNAIIVTPSADLDLAVRGILFGAYGTAGQRCTTTRRVIAHESIHDELVSRLDRARAQLKIGSPIEPGNLIGPLIDKASFDGMQAALVAAREQGRRSPAAATVPWPTPTRTPGTPSRPWCACLRRRPSSSTRPSRPSCTPSSTRRWKKPSRCRTTCRKALSSAIFTNDVREAEAFMAASRLGLRHRQRQHRHLGRRDRWRVWWREGNRRRPRVRLGCLEGVHATHDQYGQLLA